MKDIVATLHKEHANISQLLDVLQRQVDAFDRGERPDYDIVEGVADYFLSYPDLYHHPKEDLIFEKLKQRDPAVVERIGDLRREHDELAARTRKFATGVRAILDEAGVSRESFHQWAVAFIDLQRDHLMREERLFFPAALSALTPGDWAEIADRISDNEDPLFDAAAGGRYDALRRNILSWANEPET